MSKVLLGDVAKERRETCKGSKEGYPIVGLEHLTPEEITLTAWDKGKENTFSKLFREGDILFGRRRAYLKKAAVAPFDGICSGDITVIESIPERILPELLPFIIQNDALFDFAVGKSAGSLSPRVKWENLKNYEFELPDMDKQRELAKILWAIDTTKKTYQKLLQKTDELVKSQFIEMFGDPETNSKEWPTVALGDISFITKLAGFEYSKYIKYQDSGEIIMVRGLNCKKTKLILDDIYWVDKATSDLLPRSKLAKGDIVLTYVGTVGEVALIDEDDRYHLAPNVAKISLNDKIKNSPEYWAYLFMITRDYVVRFASSTTQAAINMEKIRKIVYPHPPIELQNLFVEVLKQSDKSKFELEQALKELDFTYKKIISENLG
ncbi:type I restriction enzyme, S subunit [Paenibacillus sp. cl6col]|uniref:restriction endonuclease subunit S n=1 Tax=Paenibacillus sp. cl6col TaxID=1761878 RepID=UPI00087EBE30|nr:restriction endonuclease subunit S [Paenibacillus sp. cl6col]SDF86950.1 type I restriction enzyme, S subunit [Paenibacillus sp. cl6col]